MEHQIEIIRVDECPSWEHALKNLERVLTQLDIEAPVAVKLIQSQQEALDYEFSGSPMIRFDGRDLFPVSEGKPALHCRVFLVEGKFAGWPTEKMIEDAINQI
jgi:hypothetical protein